MAEPLQKRARLDDDVHDDVLKGIYVQGSVLRDLLSHLRDSLGFEPKVPQLDGFLAQYVKDDGVTLPVHTVIKDTVPRFLNKRYLLEGLILTFRLFLR